MLEKLKEFKGKDLDFFRKDHRPLILGIALIVLFLLAIYLGPFNGLEKLGLISQKKGQEQTSLAKAPAKEANPSSEFLSNEILIKVKKEVRGKVKEGNPQVTGMTSINNLNKELKVNKFERVAKVGKNSKTDAEIFSWYKITLPEKGEIIEEKTEGKKTNEVATDFDQLEKSQNIKSIVARYQKDPNIEAVELNYIVHTTAVPNDPYYSSTGSWGQTYPDLWGIKKINPEPTWDQTTGSTSIVVADVDTGVDRNHQDLTANMWVNTAETPNNNSDDDNNGYVDDYYGWDWVNNDNDPMDDHGHGTHTAGTIAAVGNNGVGVVGVNWTSRIMALKFLNYGGSGDIDDGVTALQYAADMGAKVSSNSWGCACQSTALEDAIQYEHDRGMVMVAAAANSSADALGFSPASADYAMTIAASDSNDAKASFSNWGEKIDVAAPGVNILSTRATVNPMCTAANTVGTNYCVVSGTSMATPHVAGLAALLFAKNPSLTNEEIRQIIRNGADDLGAVGKDSSFGYGRINASGSMLLSGTKPLTPIITSPKSRTIVFGTNLQVIGSVPGPNFASYKIEIGLGRTPSTWTNIANSNTQPTTNSLLATVDTTQFPDGFYIFRLTATTTTGKSYQFQIHDVNIDNVDATIISPNTYAPLAVVDIIGSAQTKNGLGFNSYTVEWGQGSTPASWSTSGITLVNSGATPVVNGKLGTWDTRGLINGQQYSLRLSVKAANGVITRFSKTITIDNELVPGWPKSLETDGIESAQSTPAIADLDGDGQKEIIVLAPAGKIMVYCKNGTDFPGFPVSVGANLQFYMPPNIDDIDGDGKKEIISLASDSSAVSATIFITRSDGSSYPGWPNPRYSYDTHYNDDDITPAVADLDGDGKKELIFVARNFYLTALRLNGTSLPGFPITLPYSTAGMHGSGALAIKDVDNDGKAEIFVATYERDKQSTFGSAGKSYFYLYDSTGRVLTGWPFSTPLFNGGALFPTGPAAFADVDADGTLEVFVRTMGYDTYSDSGSSCSGGCPGYLYGFSKRGSLLPGWPKLVDTSFLGGSSLALGSPSVADVNNDGKDDIVAYGSEQGLTVYDGLGNTLMSATISALTTTAIADIDGDDKLEFLSTLASSSNVYVIDDNGSLYWNRSLDHTSRFFIFNAPSVLADADNNGKLEIAAVRSVFYSNPAPFASEIFLWEIPTSSGQAQYEWPMFGHNPARTSRLVLNQQPIPIPTPTPTPPPDDTQLPTVSITSPTSGSTVTKKSTVTITANATDNVGVSRVQLYINGALTCTDTSSPYSCSWKVPAAPGKTYRFQAQAFDTTGNFASSAIITVTSSR